MADDSFVRSLPFTFLREGEASSDGRTLEGYAAVFNSPTRINDDLGEYDEVIAPGAFRATLKAKTPVLMFEHGRHPLYGSLPIGAVQELKEDVRGLYLRAHLFDTWLNEPLAAAIRDQAVDGMSFRFSVPPDKDTWERQRDGTQLRTLREVKLHELGPVVFPAYADTTVALRSLRALAPEYFLPDREAEAEATAARAADEAATETGTSEEPAATRNSSDEAAHAHEPAAAADHSSRPMTPVERKQFARQLVASRVGVERNDDNA